MLSYVLQLFCTSSREETRCDVVLRSEATQRVSSLDEVQKNAFICVAIILYFVKRRNPLRRFAPQHHVARYARDAESSALRLSTTFMLKDIQTTRSERRNWRASR